MQAKNVRRTETPLVTVMFLAVLGATALVWSWDINRREEMLLHKVRLTTEQLAKRLETFFADRLRVLEELADCCHSHLANDPTAFRREAEHFLRLFPSMQAINFIDAQGVIRIVIPEEGNLSALGRNLFQHPEPAVAETLRRAAGSDTVVRTPVITLLQGMRGFATYRRVCGPEKNCLGFINGVFAIEKLLEGCISDLNLQQTFCLLLQESDGTEVLRLNTCDNEKQLRFRSRVEIRVAGAPFLLTLAPTFSALDELSSFSDVLIPLGGLVSAGLLSILVRTEIRRRRRLRESEARYRALFASAGDAIFLLEGDRFLECNPRTTEMFACHTEDILGQTPYRFSPPRQPDGRESREKALEKIAEAHRRGPITFEWTHSKLDGSTFECEVTLSRLQVSGKPYLLAVVRDVSARKEAERRKHEFEQRLLETQKLESVGVLAGGIAHEFNNLLAVVLGNADLALSSNQAGGDVRQCLTEIRGAAERAANLTNQMLAYAERGRLLTGPVNLNDLVHRHLGLMQASISKKATLHLDLAGRLQPIAADENQLRQVLMNLVTNASEALGDRPGNITVRTALKKDILPGEAGQRELVLLEVSDDGCGMDEEVRRRIFDPFFTTKFAGRGLGMAAVYGIVRSHGGAIEVNSKPGHGTTVRILLPTIGEIKALAVEPPISEEAQPVRGGYSATVLLVDDEPFVRQVGRKMLERLGCRVITADDGDQALDIFRSRRSEIDLVMLDMTMPRKSGDEVFAELLQVDERVPIILCSGFSEQDAAVRLGARRPAAFLHKPYDLVTLEEGLSKALGKR